VQPHHAAHCDDLRGDLLRVFGHALLAAGAQAVDAVEDVEVLMLEFIDVHDRFLRLSTEASAQQLTKCNAISVKMQNLCLF